MLTPFFLDIELVYLSGVLGGVFLGLGLAAFLATCFILI